MRYAYILSLLIALCAVQGCADLNITNPFESSTSDVNETYYDQFPDVPIPRDMTVDTSRSLVSIGQDGVKTGLVTVEGRVEKSSLANAMLHNMSRQGWSLRGAVTGARTVHLYEKDNRYALIYLYDQTTTMAMELWIVPRVGDGVFPGGITGQETEGGTPSFYLTPGNNTVGSEAGIHQEGLSQ